MRFVGAAEMVLVEKPLYKAIEECVWNAVKLLGQPFIVRYDCDHRAAR
jgi:hypothetical protein